MPDLEFRAGLELRAAAGRRLVGIAVPYNTEADIGGAFREVIRSGAFAQSLSSGADVLALMDHDGGRLLGRVKSGSLMLTDTARGLGFTLELPDTQAGRDVAELARRGDLGGCSVGMIVREQEWPASDRREIRSADLAEISIVSTHPAYPDTVVALRSRDASALARKLLNPAGRKRYLETL
jgi:HK97 family phage prohead protease